MLLLLLFIDLLTTVYALKNGYMVLFPLHDTKEASLKEHEQFKEMLKDLQIPYKQRYVFTEVMNGFSFQVDSQYASQVKVLPGVKPVDDYLSPRAYKKDLNTLARESFNISLKHQHGVTGVDQVHQDKGYKGRGVKVGIIDSGIDYNHPALGGCFGPNCRVKYGHNFIADFDLDNEDNPERFQQDPMDCLGHGTHVAGIIGANDESFKGVAPEVTFGAYRVFNCDGLTTNDAVIAAMERALLDGMDIVNLSLRRDGPWARSTISLAAERLVERGVIVVAAMGNDGGEGLWKGSAPALADGVISVGSVDNTRYIGFGFRIDDLQNYGYYPSIGDFTKLTRPKLITPPMEYFTACRSLPSKLGLEGKVVLIKRGECDFDEKVKNLVNANIAGVLVYDNVDYGAFQVKLSNPVNIPIGTLTQATGIRLSVLLAQRKEISLEFLIEPIVQDNPYGGKVSLFSSWGPGPLLEMKPDICAPGGLIHSTYPLSQGGFNTQSGTSMATAYVSGAVALFVQANGKFAPSAIKSVLQKTATPISIFGTKHLHPLQQQGAGLINIGKAIDMMLIGAAPSSFNLQRNPRTKFMLYLRNHRSITMTYQFHHRAALIVKPWDDNTGEIAWKPRITQSYVDVTFSQKEATLRSNENIGIEVNFNVPSYKGQKYLYSGFIGISFELKGMNQTMHIPYSGISTDGPLDVNVFPKKKYGLPLLIDPLSVKQVKSVKDGAAVYSMKNGDFPRIVVRWSFPCEEMIMKLHEKQRKSTKTYLIVSAEGLSKQRHIGRSDYTTNLYQIYTWEGKRMSSEGNRDDAPNGVYRIEVEARKPFATLATENWLSPWFNINRGLNPPPRELDLKPLLDPYINKLFGKAGVESLASLEDSVLPRPFEFTPETF